MFRALADWIVNEGKARNQDDEAMVREILHVLAAYEHLSEKIVNGKNHGGIGRYKYLGRHDSKSLGLHHVRVRGPAFQSPCLRKRCTDNDGGFIRCFPA